MNDVKQLLERAAERVDVSPDIPTPTARRARRARLRSAVAGGAALVVLVAGGAGLALQGRLGFAPAGDNSDPRIVHVATGTEGGVDWELRWLTRSDNDSACLQLAIDGASRGCAGAIRLRWIPEMHRTIVWGSVPGEVHDVAIELDPGGGYAGRLHDAGPDLPRGFIQFLPGPEIAGYVIAAGPDGPIWAHTFVVDGHTTRVGTADPYDLKPDFGPGRLEAVDSGEFQGWPYHLRFRATDDKLCVSADTRMGLSEACARRAEVAGGFETLATIPARNRVLVMGLVGENVDEVKVEYPAGDRYPQQLVYTHEEGIRAFSAVLPIGPGEVVAYDVDGKAVERRSLSPAGDRD